MLQIPQTQIDQLDREGEADFVRRIMEIGRRNFPPLNAVPDPDLEQAIALLREKAEGYGLKATRAQAKYIMVAFALGADFDTEFDEAQAFLTEDREDVLKARDLSDWASSFLRLLLSPEKALEGPE